MRETWAPYEVDDVELRGSVIYRASYDESEIGSAKDQGATIEFNLSAETCAKWKQEIQQFEVFGEKWRPSIHMPRWASRITLEVTGVRVERVQEISEADAFYEGVERIELSPGPLLGEFGGRPQYGHPMTSTYEHAFRVLWDKLNGPRGCGWDDNPFVWVIEFKRIESGASE